MLKTEGIKAAQENQIKYGGQWHTIRVGDEYWDVHNSWFDKHDFHDEIVFSGEKEEVIVRKLSGVRKLIVKFNTFLLWLFRLKVNVKRNKDSS